MHPAMLLIVEGDPDLLELLRFLFEREGYTVLCAHDGEGALRFWRAQAPDLIVLDVGLPRGGGWETLSTIRAHSGTPVVILTASDAAADVAEGIALGASEYLTKPFYPRQLLARVQSQLGRIRGTAAAPGPSSANEH